MKQNKTAPQRSAPCLLSASRFGLAFSLGFLLLACDPVQELAKTDLGDIRPPELNHQEIADDGTIRLVFDEAVSLIPDSLQLSVGPSDTASPDPAPTIRQGAPGATAQELILVIDGQTQPGREYAVELTVQDQAGNDLTMIIPFYGANPHPAGLRINEALTKISTKNRDCLEFIITCSGNLGGLSVFLGVPEDYDACYSFPPIDVSQGDFVLLHCKPESIPGELDELEGITVASGLNSSPLARDFWWQEAPGLPDDTGIITVANNPAGLIKEALFYSNKLTVAGKDYRSFGTKKLMDRADALQAAAAWKCQQAIIAVEDAARSEGMTSTRTLCRTPDSSDSDQALDWHIVPTGQASLGAPNSAELYVAPVN
jgi:hypothetical protein